MNSAAAVNVAVDRSGGEVYCDRGRGCGHSVGADIASAVDILVDRCSRKIQRHIPRRRGTDKSLVAAVDIVDDSAFQIERGTDCAAPCHLHGFSAAVNIVDDPVFHHGLVGAHVDGLAVGSADDVFDHDIGCRIEINDQICSAAVDGKLFGGIGFDVVEMSLQIELAGGSADVEIDSFFRIGSQNNGTGLLSVEMQIQRGDGFVVQIGFQGQRSLAGG